MDLSCFFSSFFVFAMPLYTSIYMCPVVTCFVVSNSEFVTLPLVSWVMCGT